MQELVGSVVFAEAQCIGAWPRLLVPVAAVWKRKNMAVQESHSLQRTRQDHKMAAEVAEKVD